MISAFTEYLFIHSFISLLIQLSDCNTMMSKKLNDRLIKCQKIEDILLQESLCQSIIIAFMPTSSTVLNMES